MTTPFTPHKLPLENLDWLKFIDHIGSANRSVARFDGLLQSIPNAKVLLSPLTTKEAVLSSRIEGTQATLEDVLAFEAKPNKKVSNYDDIQEVINYRNAMEMAIDSLDELPLSARLIKEIHKVLLTGARGHGKNPGNFRTGSVFVGQQGLGIESANYVPPEPQHIAECFSNFEKYIHYDEKDSLVQLAIVHAQFEIIHPFWDGNGRTGRILMPLFLYYKKVLSSPMLYLSEYFESNREAYYERLRKISENNDWENWIKYFLIAVEQQSEKNIEKIEQVLTLYNDLKERIVNIPTPKNAIKVLDFLFSNPFFNSTKFINGTGIKKRNGFKILNYLTGESIIDHNDKQRNKTYYFNDMIKIIN